MKLPMKLGVVALFTGSLAAVPAAVAAPPASLTAGTSEGTVATPKMPLEKHMQFLEARLETMHTALKLKKDQEAAWKRWSDSVKAARPDWKEKHPDVDSLAKLPVPERLEKMVAFAKERLARLEERFAETKTFYAVLSPEQQKTFDKEFNFWPHAGHHGKPGTRGRSLIGPKIGSQ